MNSLQDYRTRCYDVYMSEHWKYSHSFSKEAYDFFSKISSKRFKKVLPTDKNIKILDVACGNGYFLYFLQKQGYVNSTGIDLGHEQLESAHKAGVKNLIKTDLFEYLPEHLQSFDLIVANDIIEHLKKDEVLKFLDCIYASLKPNGKVLLATVNAESLFGCKAMFVDFTHEQIFTPISLSQVMRVCGFKDVVVYGEKPVIHDLKSAIRSVLWRGLRKLLKIYTAIENGTGRGVWKQSGIFESRMFVVGKKLNA